MALKSELWLPGYIELWQGDRLVKRVDNLVVSNGRNIFAQLMIGNAVTGVSYLALGTGSNPPVDADTSLQTEGYRQAITTKEIEADTIVKLTTFISQPDANGTTWNEVGLFGNGASGTANSGTLIARANLQWIKTSTETYTIVWRIPLKVR